MGIIQVSKNFIPDYLKGLVGFPGSAGIGSCSTPASGPSFPVFFFYVYLFSFFISWYCCYMVPDWVVFCYIIRYIFLFLLPECVEMVSYYSVSGPIKSYVGGSIYFCFAVLLTMMFATVL